MSNTTRVKNSILKFFGFRPKFENFVRGDRRKNGRKWPKINFFSIAHHSGPKRRNYLKLGRIAEKCCIFLMAQFPFGWHQKPSRQEASKTGLESAHFCPKNRIFDPLRFWWIVDIFQEWDPLELSRIKFSSLGPMGNFNRQKTKK